MCPSAPTCSPAPSLVTWQGVQDGAKGGHYVRKAAPSAAQRRMLGALVLLQDGTPGDGPKPDDAVRNAANIKAASYFLGIDAVGLSRCPDWTWYSHDATGEPIDPPHDQAISMIIYQGFETMEGASGDDWISVAQSMRAYLWARALHGGGHGGGTTSGLCRGRTSP